MDNSAVPREGYHAVRHVEEQRVQLVTLIFRLLQGLLEASGHVVERAGEHADLIPGGHCNLMGKITCSHTLGPLGEPLNRSDHGLGKEEGQQYRNDHTEYQRSHNERNKLAVQGANRLAAVQNVDDIASPAPFNAKGDVHNRGRYIAFGGAAFAIEHFGQIARYSRKRTGQLWIGGRQAPPIVSIQHIIPAAAVVDTQVLVVAVEHLTNPLSAVFLIFISALQVPQEGLIGESSLHLGMKIPQIIAHHRVDKEGPHNRHQRHDEQHHNENQLHMQTAKHEGTPPFRFIL